MRHFFSVPSEFQTRNGLLYQGSDPVIVASATAFHVEFRVRYELPIFRVKKAFLPHSLAKIEMFFAYSVYLTIEYCVKGTMYVI